MKRRRQRARYLRLARAVVVLSAQLPGFMAEGEAPRAVRGLGAGAEPAWERLVSAVRIHEETGRAVEQALDKLLEGAR